MWLNLELSYHYGTPLSQISGCSAITGHPLGQILGCYTIMGHPLGQILECSTITGHPLVKSWVYLDTPWSNLGVFYHYWTPRGQILRCRDSKTPQDRRL